jgi:hypothetical protein
MKQAAGKVQFHNKRMLSYKGYTEGSVGGSSGMIANVTAATRAASSPPTPFGSWLTVGSMQLKASIGGSP